ncbi:Yls3 [Thalictrum thalictroides]|uniref:Yls3 n=1 Tax=Thalictrum thalictroides TaxID=46969 RepID=A0A7J6VCH2_THATH|nr:Yls3 [Thalictrum thalictroides]
MYINPSLIPTDYCLRRKSLDLFLCCSELGLVDLLYMIMGGSHYYMNTVMITFMMAVTFVKPDISKDRDECASQLVGLQTCLPYISGTAKEPPQKCCSGLKELIMTSKKCLCVLVKDQNDPLLGSKINATLAFGLPSTCKVPTNVSECFALLNLPPNSPDAKVFHQFPNATNGSVPADSNGKPANSNKPGSDEKEKNHGCRTKKMLGMKTVVGFVLCKWETILLSHFRKSAEKVSFLFLSDVTGNYVLNQLTGVILG